MTDSNASPATTASTAAPIRVLLAEDHTIVRQGLVALLRAQRGIEVVGEAEDGLEAVAATQRLLPDVVVMDLAMPRMQGLEAMRRIHEECPKTAVLVLSMHASEEHVRPAIRAGARGYLLKGSGLSDLVAAIRAVAAGEAFLSPAVATILLRDARAAEDEASGPLTTREREVVRLVGSGKSSPEIGKILGLSAKTVEGYRGRIMAKLDLHDVAGLVRYAVRTGLVSSDD